MPKVEEIEWDKSGTKAWRFWCEGCQGFHAAIDGRWGFNGDYEKPTFTPSILVTNGHYSKGHTGPCWCSYNKENRDAARFQCSVCHIFVTDGKIQYLSDCTHALAGQTVEMVDVDSV